jgi:hypothetical protein
MARAFEPAVGIFFGQAENAFIPSGPSSSQHSAVRQGRVLVSSSARLGTADFSAK